jgi:hypothetical protein
MGWVNPDRLEERPRRALEVIFGFVSRNGYWPSRSELAWPLRNWTGGESRWCVWRVLKPLRDAGLVRSVGQRWRLTEKGFSVIGERPIAAWLKRDPKVPSSQKRVAMRKRRLARVAAWRVYVEGQEGEWD